MVTGPDAAADRDRAPARRAASRSVSWSSPACRSARCSRCSCCRRSMWRSPPTTGRKAELRADQGDRGFRSRLEGAQADLSLSAGSNVASDGGGHRQPLSLSACSAVSLAGFHLSRLPNGRQGRLACNGKTGRAGAPDMTRDFPAGNYRFIPAVFQYSERRRGRLLAMRSSGTCSSTNGRRWPKVTRRPQTYIQRGGHGR